MGGPVAALEMRLNADAKADLVVLAEGIGTPFVVPSAPASVINVDSTAV